MMNFSLEFVHYRFNAKTVRYVHSKPVRDLLLANHLLRENFMFLDDNDNGDGDGYGEGDEEKGSILVSR